MRFLSNAPKHWVVPAALASALVVALFISPAVGGPKFVTAKKVTKTINKRTNAVQLVTPATKTLNASEQVIAPLELRPGSYLVRSTFTVTRPVGAQVICHLRLIGVAQDTYTSSHDAGTAEHEEGAAMETAGRLGTASQAQLVCSSTVAGASVRAVEITALKVPKLRLIAG